jgi:hypothetical protein
LLIASRRNPGDEDPTCPKKQDDPKK